VSGCVGVFGDSLVERFVSGRLLLIARERDIGAGFEELLPELELLSVLRLRNCDNTDLRALPYFTRMLCVLLDYRQNARRDNPMRSAEVVVDFCDWQSDMSKVGNGVGRPWRVKVIDCSSFSSSSVRERGLC
jgi:hypothetical protein